MTHTTLSHRRGFTLTELLATIAIIGLMIALLMPAVQAAREAARKTSCANNLTQIGKAFHSYHSANSKLPPGCTIQNLQGGIGLSFHVLILAYLEQEAMFNQFDRSFFLTNWSPSGSIFPSPVVYDSQGKRQLSIYLCPSSQTQMNLSTGWPFRVGHYTTHYYGIMGPSGTDESGRAYNGFVRMANWPPGFGTGRSTRYGDFSSNGLLYPGRELSFAHCTDGASNTFLLGEASWFQGDTAATSPYRSWLAGMQSQGAGGYELWESYCCKRVESSLGSTRFSQADATNTRLNSFSFGSDHGSQGTNFLLADGAVRFMAGDTSLNVLRYMSSYNRREMVTPE